MLAIKVLKRDRPKANLKEREKALEIAKNTLALGLSIEQTAKISGLSVEEIRRL